MEFIRVNKCENGIVTHCCSSDVYFTNGDSVERVQREFIPNLILYRYRDCPMFDNIELLQFKVIRETDASYLLIDNDKERWVRKNATRSFAYDNKKDAWRNFRKRKEKQLKILKNYTRRIDSVIRRIRKIEADEVVK